MNRQDLDAIDRQLSEELTQHLASAKAQEVPQAQHPEPQELALYLDGHLSSSARQGVEQHLADCADCRRLAMESRLALDHESANTEETATAVWRSWPAFALVVSSLIAIVSLLPFRQSAPSDATRLAEIGIPRAAIEAAGPEIVKRAVRGLTGQWPRPAGFDSFLDGGQSVMRGASDASAPLPLAPRWSVIDTDRPQFHWRLELEADEIEILVVDENEELLTAFSVATTDRPMSAGAVSFPSDAPPIAPGQAYAWKVNARIQGEWVASPYVPFRRASADERRIHEAELTRTPTSPLLRAVVLASSGRYHPALEVLQKVAEPERSGLIDSILVQQNFSATERESECKHWTIVVPP